MSDTTAIFTACLGPLLCLIVIGLIGAGIAYWFISKKKSKEKEAAQTTDAPAQTTVTTFAPGSVSAVSQEIGYDVRDLMMMGFTHQEISSFSKEEIMSVVNGKRTLQELRNEKNPPTKKAPYPQSTTAAPVKKSVVMRAKPTLSEKQINELVWGLWADRDPNEADFRDAMRFAGQYRKECERKLRELGKDAIPYLEPYADRKEVAPLLEELKKL